jgi:hypothetical protein
MFIRYYLFLPHTLPQQVASAHNDHNQLAQQHWFVEKVIQDDDPYALRRARARHNSMFTSCRPSNFLILMYSIDQSSLHPQLFA